MKKIGDIINGFNYRAPLVSSSDKNPEEDEAKTKEYINYIFKQIKSICTAYNVCWPDMDVYIEAKRSWFKAFTLAGIKDANLIENGLNHLRLRCDKDAKFVPTSGQFIEMCLKDIYHDLPSLHEAWQEVKKQISESEKKWSHVCIQHAYKQTGSWDLKHLSEKDALALFTRNYEISCRMFREGKEFDPILPALPKQHYASKQTEEARKTAMEKMRNSLK